VLSCKILTARLDFASKKMMLTSILTQDCQPPGSRIAPLLMVRHAQ
jgi:hypothetical protein